jgi:hypothetical protein
MTARHRALDLLAHRLDRAANIVSEVLDHLDEQRANVPAISAQDTSRGTRTLSAISNPTLAAVQQLDSIEYRRREIHDHIATLELAVKLLEQACRRALAYRAGQSDNDWEQLAGEPRCIECNQIPTLRTSRDGLTIDDGRCLDCGARHDRERYERAALRLVDRMNRKAR